jgi:FMN phosphatase YigB (HAD superfamily)
MVRPPEMVLFDLGGVLIELRGVASMAELAGIDDEGELWRRWLDCRWVRTFEAGRCGSADFAQGVVDDWELPVGPEEFLGIFTSWPTGPLDGAEDLVRATAAVAAVGCFSNTNTVHWDGNVEHWPLIGLFAYQFVSHRMGQVKPDAAAFERVAESLPVAPDRVLFVDDNLANVEAARSLGFPAEHVAGVRGAREALEGAGLI